MPPTKESRALLRTKGAQQWRSTPLKRALGNAHLCQRKNLLSLG